MSLNEIVEDRQTSYGLATTLQIIVIVITVGLVMMMAFRPPLIIDGVIGSTGALGLMVLIAKSPALVFCLSKRYPSGSMALRLRFEGIDQPDAYLLSVNGDSWRNVPRKLQPQVRRDFPNTEVVVLPLEVRWESDYTTDINPLLFRARIVIKCTLAYSEPEKLARIINQLPYQNNLVRRVKEMLSSEVNKTAHLLVGQPSEEGMTGLGEFLQHWSHTRLRQQLPICTGYTLTSIEPEYRLR